MDCVPTLYVDVPSSDLGLGTSYPEFFVLVDAFAKVRKATVSFVLSVYPSARKNLASTKEILMKSGI
jgi:hypothetical protein